MAPPGFDSVIKQKISEMMSKKEAGFQATAPPMTMPAKEAQDAKEETPDPMPEIRRILEENTDMMRKAFEGTIVPRFNDVEQERIPEVTQPYPNGVVIVLHDNPNGHNYPIGKPLITYQGTRAIKPRELATGNNIPVIDGEVARIGTQNDIDAIVALFEGYDIEKRCNLLKALK